MFLIIIVMMEIARHVMKTFHIAFSYDQTDRHDGYINSRFIKLLLKSLEL
jgi:hypothetical protein